MYGCVECVVLHLLVGQGGGVVQGKLAQGGKCGGVWSTQRLHYLTCCG